MQEGSLLGASDRAPRDLRFLNVMWLLWAGGCLIIGVASVCKPFGTPIADDRSYVTLFGAIHLKTTFFLGIDRFVRAALAGVVVRGLRGRRPYGWWVTLVLAADRIGCGIAYWLLSATDAEATLMLGVALVVWCVYRAPLFHPFRLGRAWYLLWIGVRSGIESLVWAL